jgi:outer membrane protein assembly factor BamD
VTRRMLLVVLGLAAACAHGKREEEASGPTPVLRTGSAQELDSLWGKAMFAYRHGKWSDAAKTFQQLQTELPPGDNRTIQTYFYLGEVQFARGENLDAVRHFRRVSDQAPNDPIAPDALLRVGDAYADLWKRPELDPTYGQTALAAYQELVSRYPGTPAAQKAQRRIDDLQEKFAIKEYKAALYYLRYKAWDSAILYLKDVAASYPRASIVPEALIRLVGAYKRLGYQEDIRETCGYLRRFHPKAPGVSDACPAQPGTAESGAS